MEELLETLFKALDADLLDHNGQPEPLAASVLQQIPHSVLRAWANRHGIYQVITREQIEWTKEQIAGRSAIEICAGHGTLGRALRIPITDIKLQNYPHIAEIYDTNNVPRIIYAEDVVEMDAMAAIKHYKPKVVIGCFVTQWGPYEMPHSPSSPYGPKEWEFFDHGVETYIVFGNKKVHANKRIYAMPHAELSFPWLYTRCELPDLNRVWVFDRRK